MEPSPENYSSRPSSHELISFGEVVEETVLVAGRPLKRSVVDRTIALLTVVGPLAVGALTNRVFPQVNPETILSASSLTSVGLTLGWVTSRYPAYDSD